MKHSFKISRYYLKAKNLSNLKFFISCLFTSSNYAQITLFVFFYFLNSNPQFSVQCASISSSKNLRQEILFNKSLNVIDSNKINSHKPVLLTKKLPQAIIIGAKKCGTRALLKFIGAHHNVSTAGAEVHFFDRFYHMGYDWYRDQMPFSNEHQITIEKTPKYLIDKRVAERVYKMNPNIKLIVVLRNPVIRAISEYVQSKENKLKKLFTSSPSTNNLKISSKNNQLIKQQLNDSIKFQQMLYITKPNSSNRTIRIEWPIVRNGLYIEHLKQWLKYFPVKQFLFVNGEQLIKEPSVELDKLQRFLNLRQIIKKEHFVHNRRKGFACIIKPLDSKQVKCLNEQKGRTHPNIDKTVLNELNDFYKPFNKKLFELINQPPWWPI